MKTFLRALVLAGLPALVPPHAAAQQTPSSGPEWYDGHVSIMAGVSVYDRGGVGTTGAYSLRADLPIYPSVLFEGGLTYIRPGRDEGVADVFIPGIQALLQGTSGRFSPYAGLGAGVLVETRSGGRSTEITFSPSFSAGVRIGVSEGAAIRVEGRLNAVGADFRGVYSEMGAGLVISW